jgi:DNA gyrase subunit A
MAIIDTTVQKESQDRYLTYALSVVSGRALPDVRDGLKPVQRRILYAMSHNLNLVPNRAHRKSAAVVGEVLANYHPHGDSAGQGNFGSLDGDNAAAYRYTEARLREFALAVIGEVHEGTVTFRDNFDGTTTEPTVFASKVPNLLVNGASGIAVGMATNIPPHNLREVVKAIVELAADPEITIAKLTSFIKGPDFPTGCLILNTKKEIDEIYKTGRGSICMRGEWKEEDLPRGKKAIVITSIPYAVNKSQLVEKIGNLILERKVPQLSDVRDESTDEVRVVLELSPNADPELAMAYIMKHTSLETAFAVNLTVLLPGREDSLLPELVSLKECLEHFLKFRHEVTKKKLEFEKKKLLERMHILEGIRSFG